MLKLPPKRLDGLPNSDEPHLYLNKNFGESGILEWFGIKVIHVTIPDAERPKMTEAAGLVAENS